MEKEEEEVKEKLQILMDSGCIICTCRINLHYVYKGGRRKTK